MEVDRVFSKSPFEIKFGFCRALRRGSLVHVAGTAPIGEDGTTVGVGDAAAQARRCLDIAVTAMAELGAKPEHVVRTRMFLTDIKYWPEVGAVHGEYFSAAPPVSTMVEVAGLIDPSWLVEIEVEAWLD